MTGPHANLRGTLAASIATEQHPDPESAQRIAWIAHLLRYGEDLCGQLQGGQWQEVSAHLCAEVALISQGHARLVPQTRGGRRGQEETLAALAGGIPVTFGGQVYATLYLFRDPGALDASMPLLALDHLLADVCGWMLHTLELSAFVAQQSQHLAILPATHLTSRERAVLALLSQGCALREIAARLSIAPATAAKHQQHLREKLGVHHMRDAVLAGHAAGLFSALEEVPG